MRYEVKTDEFGQFFFDKETGEKMPLQDVVNRLNRKSSGDSHPVLDLTFECMDLNKTLSIRGYLKELMIQLMTEQEGFSGKRPFGNSGWTHDMEKAMVEAGIVDGELDDHGYLKRSDSKGFIHKLIASIKEI